MIDIELSPKYKITSDPWCYSIRLKTNSKDRKGNRKWDCIKSYPTLEQTLKGYKEMVIRESDCTSFPEIIELIKDLDRKIEDILQGN